MGREETGREEMILVWACFTFRLNWFGTNNKLRTHGPRSPHQVTVLAAAQSVSSSLLLFGNPFDCDFESVVQISCNDKTTGIGYS